MLATLRVALHYVRCDNYHVLGHAVWLNSDSLLWNLTRDASRFVEIVLYCKRFTVVE